MELGIAGKWALVCAGSKGLGKGCATALVRDGVNVVSAPVPSSDVTVAGNHFQRLGNDGVHVNTGRRVLVVGNGLSAPLAVDAAARMVGIGRHAEAPLDVISQQVSARQLGAGDALLVISGSGANQSSVRAAEAAGVGRYVIVSSVGAEAPPDGDDVFSVYLRAKAEADQAVMASSSADRFNSP